MYEKGEGTITLTDELREEFKKDKSIDETEEPGNSLKELNKNRESKNLETFSFRDNNLDDVNQ